jgi:predicted extracellular nuclease
MTSDSLTVATFNLYNLQLPDRNMNPGQRWTPDEYERKVRWTGAQLKELDADVVGLQELWNRDAMAEVLEKANLDDDYELLADPATGGKIVCGAIVRKEPLSAGSETWIDFFPEAMELESTSDDRQAPNVAVSLDGFSRPVLRFQIHAHPDTWPIQVFVAHFKSKLPARIHEEPWYDKAMHGNHRTALGAALSTIRRTAEAAALRVILTDVMKGTVTPVIVLGDLNDGQHSNTVNILSEQPRYLVGGSMGGADIGLYTAQTLQEYRDSRDVYYTHVHNDLRESLDHVLVSEQFYDNSNDRQWVFDGLSIYNDHLNDTEANEHKLKGTGDHGLVRVRFKRVKKKQS